MKKFILLSLLVVLPFALRAQRDATCEANGVSWLVSLYDSDHHAEIYGTSSVVNGALNIPETVIDNGVTYTITKLKLKEDSHGSPIGGIHWMSRITNLYIPETVETIGQYFFQSKGVTELHLSEGLKEIGKGAFAGSNITELNLPEGIEEIGAEAFAGCTKLKGDLVLPRSLRKIDAKAFTNCPFDGTLYVRAQEHDDGTFLFNSRTETKWYGGIFYHSKFKKVVLEGERPAALCNPSRISNGHGGVIYTHYSSLVCNEIPIILEINPEVKKLAPYALTEINLSATNPTNMLKNVEEIGSSAFQGCHLEGQLTIPLSVKKMGSLVFGNNNISSVKIESTQLTEIPQGFLQWNSQLNQITWPDNITVIGEYAFSNCSSLVNVTFPGHLREIKNRAFSQCTSLTNILPFPSGLERIEDAFSECTKLRGKASDFLPASLREIDTRAFMNNKGITGELIFPDHEISPLNSNSSSGYTSNPFIGTSIYGIRMNNFKNYFNRNAHDHIAWGSPVNLLYIDCHKCTVFSSTTEPYISHEVYKFNRKPFDYGSLDLTRFPEFSDLSVNTMVYLPSNEAFNVGDLPHKNFEDRFNDENAENFIMDGKCAHFFVKDGLPYRIPYGFTALEAKYDRVFSPTGGKNVSTLYLPYPTNLPAGMKAYKLVSKGVALSGTKAFFFEQVVTPLRANTPYLVQVTDGATHTLPTMYNVEVPASPCFDADSKFIAPSYKRSSLQATETSDWNFYGTTERINNDEAYIEKAFYLKQSQWWSVRQNEDNDFIAPFRCFISSPTGAVPAKSFVMVLDGDDNAATNIKELENTTDEDMRSGRYPFYTTDGKLAGHDYNALSRGQIYIVNGKKFYKF